jgi:hypothetical protein
MDRSLYLALGTAFGFVLSRSGATDYDTVQRMFLLQDFQLWGVIASAVTVTLLGLQGLRRWGRTATGAPLRVSPKPRHPGNWMGGLVFGAGWSLTGMCPGPILVNVGEGKLYALGALAGALVGAALLARVYERIAPALRLPPFPEPARR